MANEESKQWLYKKMTDAGYNVGRDYETFDKALANQESRDWLYEKAKSIGLNVGDSVQFNSLMGYAEPPAAAEQKPTKSGYWQSIGAHNPYALQLEQNKKEEEKQEQLRREEAATMPLSQQDKERADKINQLQTEGTWGKPNGTTFKIDRKTGLPVFTHTEGDGMHLSTDATNAHQDEIDRLKAEQPSYITREIRTPQDLYISVSEAWSANTPEGQKAKAELDQHLQTTHDNLLADLNKQIADLRQQVANGTLSQEEAQRQAEQAAQNANAIYENETKLEQYYFTRQMQAANADYLAQQTRRLGQQATNQTIDDLNSHITTEVDRLKKEREQTLSRAYDRAKSAGGGAYGTIGAVMSANADYDYTKDYELALYHQSQQFLDDAAKISRAAQDKQGFFRAFGQSMSDIDTWDFGISQLVRSANLKEVVEKYEQGKTLTDAEKSLMDAAVAYMSACAYNSDQLTRRYKAGQTMGESVPFMLQFMVMPTEAIKSKVAKAAVGYGIERFGGKAAQTAAKYTAETAFKEAVAALLGNLAAAGVQTATFGVPKIAEGAISRMTGDIEPTFDENGKITYGGRSNQQGAAEAIYNATVDQYVENLSEMIMTTFDPLKAYTGTTKLLKGLKSTEIAQVLGKMNEGVIGKIRNRAQFRNYLEEVSEEYVGNLMRWGMSTDVHTADEAGFSIDQQIDTWLGLAPTSLFFAGLNAAERGVNRIQSAVAANRLRKVMEDGEERKYLESLLRSDDNSDVFAQNAHAAVKSILRNKKLEAEDKRFLLDEIYYTYQDKVAAEAEAAKAQAEAEQQQAVRQQAEAEVAPLTNQTDGKVYAVTRANDASKSGHIVSGKIEIDTTTPDRPVITNDDVVTVRYADGTVEQLPARDLNLAGAPAAADEVVAQHTAEQLQAEQVKQQVAATFHAGQEVAMTDQDGNTHTSRVVSVSDEGVEVEITDAEGKPNTTIISAATALNSLQPIEPQPAQEGVEHYRDQNNEEVAFYRNADGSVTLVDEEGKPVLDEHGNAMVMSADEFDKFAADSHLTRTDNAQQDMQPVGEGDFGYIYDQFKGKAQEAIAFLKQQQSGEALGALHHKDIGGIDLVWGYEGTGKSDGFGLAKLIKYHPEVVDNLQEIINDMHIVSRTDNRIQLESDKYAAAVRLTWNDERKTWLLTAFQKKSSAINNTTDTADTLTGKRNDTATPQDTANPSADKGTTISANTQKNIPNIDTMSSDELGAATVEYMGGTTAAAAYLEAERDKAKKEVSRLTKQKVTQYTDIADFKAQNDALQAQKKAATDRLSKLEQALIVANHYKTQAEQEAAAARKAEEEAKRSARRQTEAAAATNAAPAARWQAAPKAEGNTVTRTLPDGTTIKGHYVLAEAGTATPSHDPNNGWNTSNGYPTTEDGRNINDRDYRNDKDAQQLTIQMAQTYDGQAVAQVPVVSSEGIVYDGNGRTIAGNIAAANNTDAAYIQALADNAANFGFTPEQVASMQHPRVYMQLDKDLPYNTTTLAKFNAQEKKTQSNTNRAVSNGKKLTEAARDGILAILDNYGSLDAFFASESGANDIVKSLLSNGIITQQEVAGLTETTDRGFVLSPAGKDYVTDLLIGSLFDEQTIRMLGNDKGLKQSILRAVPSIVENRRLGDYALTDDINGAIRLLYEARKAGQAYYLYIRQVDAFEGKVSDRYSPFEMLLAEEMSSGVEAFRQVLNLYNTSARDEANGQSALFEPRTIEDIKNEILQYYAKRPTTAAVEPTAGTTVPSRTQNPQTQSSVPSPQAGNEQVGAENNARKQAESQQQSAKDSTKDTPKGERTGGKGSKQTGEKKEKKSENKNKIFTEDAYEAARRRMHERLNRLNAGLDPEILSDGLIMAGYHVEKGARKFADFAKRMIEEFGDKIRPYLKSFYNGLRDLPEAEALSREMDDYATVAQFDVKSISIEEPKAQDNKPNGIMEQYRKIKEQYPDALLLFRSGDFYEVYAEDAVRASKILNITLTHRSDGTGGGSIDMAGFPFHALDTYLPKIVRAGLRVAICDQLEDTNQLAKKLVKRPEPTKSAEKLQNTLPSEEKVVPLRETEKRYECNGKSIVVDKADYKTYITDEAKALFAELSQQGEKPLAVPTSAYISFASIDGAKIPAEVLLQDPNIQAAQAEWKNNDVAFGEPTRLVWSSESDEPIPGTDNARTRKQLGEVRKSTHTKTGEDIWVVKLEARFNNEEFKLLKDRAKACGGYYSSFAKNRGFIFKSEEDANKFNRINDEDITTDQTNADTAIARNEGEVVSGEAASITRDRRNNSGAERESGAEVAEGSVREPEPVALTPKEADTEVKTRQHTIGKIDKAEDKINDQLAVLGYYEADTSDPKKFNEQYGYLKTAETKAVKDIDHLAKQLASDLGLNIRIRKSIAKANIAPIGGDIYFSLPLENSKELYLTIALDSTEDWNALELRRIMWRVEDPQASGTVRYIIPNQFFSGKAAAEMRYIDLLNGIRKVAAEYLPKTNATKLEVAKKVKEQTDRKKKDTTSIPNSQPVLDLFGDVADTLNEAAEQEQATGAEDLHNGYKVGDTIKHKKRGEVKIVDFEKDGRPVVNSFGTDWITEIVNWEDIEPQNTNNNGELRTDGRREGSTAQAEPSGQPRNENGALGGSQQPQNERPVGGRVGTSGTSHRLHDGERGGGTPLQPAEQTITPAEPTDDIEPSQWRNTRNFQARGGERLAPTTPKARYEANLAAIRLLKKLQDEDRQATPQEMGVLSQYSGWGGLGEFFKGEPGTVYYSQHGENSPYQTLASIMTPEELDAAQLSRNSAYYTPDNVINAMWQIAERLGFKGGNILEGSAGIGNIFARMPESISHRSYLTAVEIDDITAGILAQLYPDATTHHAGFQDVDIPNNSQDLTITNVPFVTDLHVYDKQEKDLSKRFGSIHDFCIAKNVRKLKQGGLGIFITTSNTLDKSKDLLVWLNNEGNADVIGAFRLNNETFGGTNATSDIIVIRKRVNGQKDPRAINVLDIASERIAQQPQKEVWDKKTGTYKRPEDKEVKVIYNNYFILHPSNMGGVMEYAFERGSTWRENTLSCYPSADINQAERLKKWVERMEKSDHLQTYEEQPQHAPTGDYEAVGDNVPYGALVVNSKGEICRAQVGKAVPIEGINSNKVKGYPKSQVANDYIAIKQAIADLLQAQTKDISDAELKPYLRKLNSAYDDFVRKYGSLNRNTSLSFLRNDVQWASIAAIEKVKETVDINGKKKVEVIKTDLFNKRVVGVQAVPKAENAKDGVILSMQQFGTIQPDKIAEWLGKPTEEVEQEILDTRLGFRNPQTGDIEVRHQYLSGNVREKLAYAEEHNTDGSLDANIEELRKVVPVDIPAHLIEFSIGSTWIPIELYKQYAKEKYDINNFTLNHVASAWVANEVYGAGEKDSSEGVYSQMVGKQVFGHELMVAAMNNVPVVVSKVERHYDGSTETITDKEASAACSDKISQIKDDFVDWARGIMQQDSELADRVQKIYNERFNAVVPMLKVDDVFLSKHLPGQNSAKYSLYPHQQQAVARGLTQPLMLAHEVGTGKTISLISTAMEMRRLGTAKKPMIVVQNATTQQFVSEAKDLYPNAKILTVSDRDRTAEGRQEFYAKIKYNDWDLIIIPQPVFDMIPDSESRMQDFINEKIEEKMHAIEAAKEAGVDANVTRSMEKELKLLQGDLETNNMSGKNRDKVKKDKDAKKEAEKRANAKARAQEMLDRKTDNIEDFDDMGIDALLIDEAHNYKHLGFATMMQRGVKGIDPSYAKRAAALWLKCQSVYEHTGHKNVIFATGTPISNTAAEIWTFMKYLMPKSMLKENDIYYFDDFVHNFGKISEQLEFATNGKYKANNRFAQYNNVPELMRLWLSVADCVLTREVGQVDDKVPRLEGGKAQDIFLEQSPSLIDIMAAVRSELAMFERMSGKEKKENSHIPLNMYDIAKRAAIDPRLVDGNAADEPLSKTNRTVTEVLRSLNDSKKYNGTVAIFCENFRNKKSGFDLFNDIKNKLIAQGVPANQIAIIRSSMSYTARQKVFDAVREGDIRVIMGRTDTLGTGVNIQTRLHTLIHMDAPDKPSDYLQRNGRILRQGNMHKEWDIPVRILRMGVKESLDVSVYQRLKTKAGFIDSIMNGKSMIDNNLENRVLEDADEGIYDNMLDIVSGSQYILMKSQAERDLRKWKAREQQHRIDQILIADSTKKNDIIIAYRTKKIADDEKLIDLLEKTFPDGKVSEYNINGTVCHTADEVKNALKELNKDIAAESDKLRADHWGDKKSLAYTISFNGMPFHFFVNLTRKANWKDGKTVVSIEKELSYSAAPLGEKPIASPTKVIDRLVETIESDVLSGKQARNEIVQSKEIIERTKKESELMRAREGKPFAHQAELEKAQALVDEYTEKMKVEMKEKEAKYAAQSHKAVNLDKLDGEDDASDNQAETQYDELDYDTDHLTPAQQLATNTLIDALDNAGIQIERVSEAEARRVLGEKGNAEFAKSRKSRIFVPTSKVPKEELAVARHALFAKVQDNTKAGVLYYADSANYTHIFVGGRHLCAIKIDGNEELIKFLEKGIDNGTYKNAANFDRWDEGIGSRKRYDNHFNASSSRQRGGNGGTDILYQGQSTDTERNRSQSVGDSGNTIQLRTGDGIIYGYAQGGKIYLTPEGLNPNTPIHEYTHLWVSAIKRKASDLYRNLQDLFSRKNLPDMWAELDRDPHYAHLSDEAKLSEIIARFSGKRGAERMEEEAQKLIDEAKKQGKQQLARAISLRERMRNLLRKMWNWVGENLFHIKNFGSREEAADRVLYDLLRGTDLGEPTKTARQEMTAIRDEAVANGLFMKAPNGKPTRLNERQWLQVRTKAFKKWFGDWEKAARIEKLRKSEPVHLTGEEYKGKYELNRDSAKQWLRDKLRGEYTIKDTGEKVFVGRKGVDKVTSHSMGNEAYLKSLVAIPQMLNSAVFISEEKAEKSNALYDRYRYYVVGLTIDGEDYTAKLTVGIDKNGTKFYDQALTEIEKGNLIEIANGFISTEAEPNPSVTDGKDTKLISILQTNASKIIDENGEPLVVYHGTPYAGFSEFDNNEAGIYFSNIDRASWYTGGIDNPQLFRFAPKFNSWNTVEQYATKNDILFAKADKEEYGENAYNVDGVIVDTIQEAEEVVQDVQNRRQNAGNIYAVFLNIRNPKYKDAKGKHAVNYDQLSHGKKYDGVIIENINDPTFDEGSNFLATNYIALSPNQIKSATDNNGSFDESSDDIRFSIIGERGAANLDRAERRQPTVSSPVPPKIQGETTREWAARIAEWRRNQLDQQQVEQYKQLITHNGSKLQKAFSTAYKLFVDKFTAIDNFQQWLIARHATFDPDTMDMHGDISLAFGRIETFSDRYKDTYIQGIADTIAAIEKDKDLRAALQALNLRWQNFEDESVNGKPLTTREIMGVYAQARDTREAEQLSLADRGAQGFVHNLGMTHDELIDAVESALPQKNIDAFWDAVYAANQFALDYQLDAGMIDTATRERYTRRYYVPQRGWRERDFDGIDTQYVKDSGTHLYGNPYNAALVRAKGRQSLASDPFALIESIGLTSIRQSEHNKSKQQLLNLLLANESIGLQSGAWTVRQVWAKNVIDPATGRVMRKPDGTPIEAEVTYAAPTQAEREHDNAILAEIDQLRRKELTSPAAIVRRDAEIDDLQNQLIYTGRATNTMIERRTRDEKLQHQVVVLKDGQQYIIELQDEALANAVNGNFGEAWKAYKLINKLNAPAIRYMSGMLTQYNPRFASRNFNRDAQAAFINNLSELGIRFATKAAANIPVVQRTIWQYIIADTYKDKESYGGKYGDYLREYFEEGVQTGFSFMPELDRMAKDFDKMIKGDNVWDLIWGRGVKGTLSMLTEASELTVRFAQFVTARQLGYSTQQAAKMAKDITVNFNQSGLVSKEMSKYFTFFNATVQGNMRELIPHGKNRPAYGKAALKFGAKLAGIAANFALLGLFSVYLNPDDPDDETWFTEYDRMSYFILFGMKIPVVHFFRMFYAAGVQAALAAQGRKTWKDAFCTSVDYALSELVPTSALQLHNMWDYDEATNTVEFDPTKYAQAAAPSVVSPVIDVVVNRDFKGATVYRKKWDEQKKNITTAKRNTPQLAQDVSNTLHRWSGGNPNVPYKGGNTDGWIDIKPNAIEHVAEGYLSGVWESIGHTAGFAYDAISGGDNYKHITNYPFLRDLFRDYSEEKAYNQEYYSVVQKLENYEKRVNSLPEDEFLVEEQSDRCKTYREACEALRHLPNPYKDTEQTVSADDINAILRINMQLNRNLFKD